MPAADTRRGWAWLAATPTATATIDLAVTNFYGESTSLFHNMGRGLFVDHTAAAGLAAPSRYVLGFGAAFMDADNDGQLDLMTANGHVNDLRPQFPFQMTAQLYRGEAGGRLADVTATAGRPFSQLHVGRGLAVGDLDNDGRIDALLTSHNEVAGLLPQSNRDPAAHTLRYFDCEAPGPTATGSAHP